MIEPLSSGLFSASVDCNRLDDSRFLEAFIQEVDDARKIGFGRMRSCVGIFSLLSFRSMDVCVSVRIAVVLCG